MLNHLEHKLKAWRVKTTIAMVLGIIVGVPFALVPLAWLLMKLTHNLTAVAVLLVLPVVSLVYSIWVMLKDAPVWAKTKSSQGLFTAWWITALCTAGAPFMVPFMVLQILGSGRPENLTVNLRGVLRYLSGVERY